MSGRFFQVAWRVGLVLILSLTMAGFTPQAVRAAGYEVSNTNDSGAGSLRQAITDANGTAGVADTITFTVSGTITLLSALPAISSDLTIDGSGQSVTISGNELVRGPHIASAVKVTLRHLTISHMKTAYDPGAGVWNEGELTVEECTFSNNWALEGGAIYSTGILTIRDSTFLDNTASPSSGHGGAILVDNTTVTISGSTFSGNHADQSGGALNVYQSGATVSNSTFEGNTADFDGGGIEVYYGILNLLNSTLSGNGASGTNGGGALKDYGGTVHVKNTILANSTIGQDCYSALGLATSLNNLFETGYQCGTSVSGVDPKLGPLANNGGPTQSMGLLRGSPAIHAGDDTTCLNAPVSLLDQRGVARTYGAHCDIGAYELKTASLTVRSGGAKDGHILESRELSGVGGTINATLTTFNLGDDVSDKQFRAILSFYTGALPEDAVMLKVVLKIHKQGVVGTNPFTLLGGLKADIRKPYFGTGGGLAAADFQATADRASTATFGATPVDSWYSAVLNSAGYPFINLAGSTQFRLRFQIDDNDDIGADLMKFHSGNHTTVSARPTLIIDYYIP